MAEKKVKAVAEPVEKVKVPNKKETKKLFTAAAAAVMVANKAIGDLRIALIARGELKANCPLVKKLAKADEIDCEFFAKVKELGY